MVWTKNYYLYVVKWTQNYLSIYLDVETDVTDVVSRLTDDLFGSKSPPLSSVESRKSVDDTDTKFRVIVAKKDGEIDDSKVQVVLASREDKHQVEVIFEYS